jgi:hypothetical protein
MRDRDIRLALHGLLEAAHGTDQETLVLDELGLCQGAVRADVAVVNGSLSGFEIKSDLDTLDRLPRQVELYSRVFDYVTLVVGRRHARGIQKRIPACWGIVVVSETADGLEFKTRRAAKRNAKVDPYAVARLLWRKEALELLALHDLDKGVRSKPRRELWRVLSQNLSIRELSSEVRKVLRAREDWRSDRLPSPNGDSLQFFAKS